MTVASDPYAIGLRARASLALALLALVGAMAVARGRIEWSIARRELGLVVALSLSVSVLALAANPALRDPAGYAVTAAATLATTAAFVLLAAHFPGGPPAVATAPAVSRLLPTAIFVGAFVAIAGVLLGARDDRPLFVDEVLYLFQATTLDEPRFGRELDDAFAPFFILPLSFVAGGRLHGQYPVGWPALLWLADAVDLRTWIVPLLGAACVALTFGVGRRLMPAWGAALAAALLAANGMFIDTGGSYFAHIPTAACILLASLSLLGAEEAGGAARDARFVVAGIALGVAAAIRPLTGVALGASVVLWVLLRGRFRGRDVARMAAMMALGAAAPVAATLYYNQVTTGDALLFGYTRAHGALHSLGFGVRGNIVYDSLGAPRPVAAPFTPVIASRNFIVMGTTFFGALLPGVSASILLVMGRKWLAGRRTLLAAASFLLLPLLHFFVYYPDVRYYTELLPFVMLGAAWLLGRVRSERPAAASALTAFVLAASALAAAGRLETARRNNEAMLSSARLVEDAHRRAGPILVFVSDPVPGESMLARLWAHNLDSFRGEIVVARDLGARNAQLARTLPDHATFRLRRTGSTDAELERIFPR